MPRRGVYYSVEGVPLDPRSMRSVKPRPDVVLTIGCPAGAWDPVRRVCAVGTKLHQMKKQLRPGGAFVPQYAENPGAAWHKYAAKEIDKKYKRYLKKGRRDLANQAYGMITAHLDGAFQSDRRRRLGLPAENPISKGRGEKIRAALQAVSPETWPHVAIAETIRKAKRIPSGHLYAAVSAHMSLASYRSIIGTLKRAGLVEERGDEIIWRAPNPYGVPSAPRGREYRALVKRHGFIGAARVWRQRGEHGKSPYAVELRGGSFRRYMSERQMIPPFIPGTAAAGRMRGMFVPGVPTPPYRGRRRNATQDYHWREYLSWRDDAERARLDSDAATASYASGRADSHREGYDIEMTTLPRPAQRRKRKAPYAEPEAAERYGNPYPRGRERGLGQAMTAFRAFHRDSRAVPELVRVKTPPGTPRYLVGIGDLRQVEYDVPGGWPSLKRGPIWYHSFRRRPILATDISGKHLYVVGYRGRVEPRGITG